MSDTDTDTETQGIGRVRRRSSNGRFEADPDNRALTPGGSCDLYGPGHNVHWIPALKSAGNAAAEERTRATLAGITELVGIFGGPA